MNSTAIIVAVAGAFTCSVGTTWLALRSGWVDRVDGAPERKLRSRPVALTGGVSMLVGALLGVIVAGAPAGGGAVRAIGQLPWPGLAAAFGLGLVDDLSRRGLSAPVKLIGQVLVAMLVVAFPGELLVHQTVIQRLLLGVWAVVCMNAVNTYDHADGLAGSLGAMALLGPAPVMAGAIAGTLPLNTVVRQPPDGDSGERAPRAMMGDSGSHWLGIVIATSPPAGWLMLIPLLDLARVALRRIQRGVPFWHGDRNHIGHRLAGLGISPNQVVVLLAVVVAPPVVAQALSASPVVLIASIVTSAGLYLVTLVITDQVNRPGGAEPQDLIDEAAHGEDVGVRGASPSARKLPPDVLGELEGGPFAGGP